jgi:hypothetical protein
MAIDHRAAVERKLIWMGWIASAVPAFILLFSAALQLFKFKGIEAGLHHLGWSPSLASSLAFLEIACAALFLFPRSAMIGAILLTAYFGGAVATQVRVGDPSYVPMLMGIVVWGGLYLREPRLRALLPLCR